MDFLNKAFAQLSDLFKSMTPAARITSGLLLAVVVVSLLYLVGDRASGADEYLLGGEPFSVSELGTAEAAFDKAGLTGYEIEGSRVKVPKSQRAAYMGALADAGAMPASFGTYLEKAVADHGPFVDKRRRAEMMIVAKQNELALIIRSMQGIERASVLYDTKTKAGFRKEEQATATVSVAPTGGPLDDDRVPMLRHMVAGAFAGLKPENVTVVDVVHNRTVSGKKGAGGTGEADLYTTTKLNYERAWVAMIKESLAYIPGIVVGVNVTLTPEIEDRQKSVELGKPFGARQQENIETSKTSGGGPGGRPGLEANAQRGGANSGGSVSVAPQGPFSETESNTTNSLNIPDKKTESSKANHPLRPDRVAVVVGIPSGYYRKVWEEQNKPADGSDPPQPTKADLDAVEATIRDDLTRYVAQLLDIPKDITEKDPTKLVEIQRFVELPTEEIEEPGFTAQSLSWLGSNWSTLGMTGLAFFSLLMIRSMVRSSPAGETPHTAPVLAQHTVAGGDEEEESSGEAPKPRLRRAAGSGVSLKEDLAEMVREDPDTAASILRNWIGTAS